MNLKLGSFGINVVREKYGGVLGYLHTVTGTPNESSMIRQYPNGSVVLVMDNLSYHKSAPALTALSMLEQRLLATWLLPYCSYLWAIAYSRFTSTRGITFFTGLRVPKQGKCNRPGSYLNPLECFWHSLIELARANHLENNMENVVKEVRIILSHRNDPTCDYRFHVSKDLR